MSNIDILKRLYKDYTKKYINKIILSVFFTLVLAGSTSAVAYLLDPAIKQLFIEQNKTYIYLIPGLIILAFALKGLSLYLAKVIMINVSEEVKKDIQTDMFSSLIKADTELVDSKHSGKFIGNLTNDVNMITALVSTAILNLFKDSLTLIGLLAVMFYQNWKLSLIAIIMIPLATIIARKLGKRMGKVATEAQEKSGHLNRYFVDLFKNHKIIKIFQRENYENIRSEDYVNALKDKSIKIRSVYLRSTPIMEVLTGFMIALLIFYSGHLIISGELNINNFFSFLAAMMLAYQPVKSLTKVNIAISQGLSAAKRILPIIDIKNEIEKNESSEEIKLTDGTIIFENINFQYYSNPDNQVLKNVSIKINGGKMTALVGHSGSGKSTLLNMIPRIYNPTSGSVKIDNQDLSKFNLSSIRKQISIVDQNTTLFDDTVFNNIKYAQPDASEKEIFNAAKLSMSEEFINNLENGYETKIGENGVKLSGGEKQRLSIARAFLKQSRIILLDEATSSLDSNTEEKIQHAIEELIYNKTTIVIAHRLSTILNSDNIYVMQKGEILDSGKHDELLNKSNAYRNFYEKQIQK